MPEKGYLESYLKENKLSEHKLIKAAFTHKSSGDTHYERLEFLGDAVLGLIVIEFLYKEFEPKVDVGELSKTKSYLVSKEVLYNIGKRNNIIKFAKYGSALTNKEIKTNKKIISDVVEALIGAVYLIKGFTAAREFVLKIYGDDLKKSKNKRSFGDYKSELQIKMLNVYGELPVYRIVKTEGEDHNKTFHIEVFAKGKIAGTGKAKTIKEAEQNAAKQAIKKIKEEIKK